MIINNFIFINKQFNNSIMENYNEKIPDFLLFSSIGLSKKQSFFNMVSFEKKIQNIDNKILRLYL